MVPRSAAHLYLCISTPAHLPLLIALFRSGLLMTTLIQDAIKTMGAPEKLADQTGASGDIKTPTSIALSASIKDWWNSSTQLMSADIGAKQGAKYLEAKLRNRKIEYDLYRSILSEEVHIMEPVSDSTTIVEMSTFPLACQMIDVEIAPDLFIHGVYLENVEPDAEKSDIVIIHGYMAALGYFVKNVEDILKAQPGVRLHVIDLPGFGNSSRPPFPRELLASLPSLEEQISQILQVENWFIDKIEAWRLKRNISAFKLIGHSMGAYLSSCYLMKYNNQEDGSKLVSEFIVASPMGTESSYVSLINDKKYQYNHHQKGGDPLKELVTSQRDNLVEVQANEDLEKLWEHLGRPRIPGSIVLRKLWEWNKSPFQLLQTFGPFYSKLLSFWSFQRFRNLKSNDGGEQGVNVDLILTLHRYSYSIFNQYQGSGELAITKLVNHEVLARLPLCDRGLVEHLVESKVKTLWLYGDKDWMNSKGGRYICEKFEKMDKGLAFHHTVKEAGHHIYLDNPPEFNRTCINFFFNSTD